MHWLDTFRAGNTPAMTVGLPGTQGATVTGIQGMGVKTPSAAAVADITAGLVGALHIPKGEILTIGAKSITVATGIMLAVIVGFIHFSGEGATPKVHFAMAMFTTAGGILI